SPYPLWPGGVEGSLTARIQRGLRGRALGEHRDPSASPGLFSRQHHIQCLPHFLDTNQLHTVDGIKLRQISFRQNASLEPHLGGLANAHFSLTDGTHLTSQTDFSQ